MIYHKSVTYISEDYCSDTFECYTYEEDEITFYDFLIDEDSQVIICLKNGEEIGNINCSGCPEAIEDLRNGSNPILDAWEDGMGNSCTPDGW